MRPLEDARRDVLSAVELLPIVDVDLDDSRRLALATAVVAKENVPPFTNSAMDGFAVQAADTATSPVELRVLEDVAAGHVAGGSVRPGTAIKIMTGAPLPEGADAVVRVEDTEPAGEMVSIKVAVGVGTAVRHAGGDVRSGTQVFPPGETITPAHMAVLASLGVARPVVHRRVVVAVLSTGDEVVAVDGGALQPSQIRDTNRPLLKALLAELGAEVIDLGIVGDDAAEMRRRIERGAADADAVITSGGVSMGEYDLVKQILTEIGSVEFWKVAMQPAKPFAFGFVSGTPLFGLPGNPVSVMVAFEQFARPALLKMMGHRALFRPRVSGTLIGGVSTDPEKTVFSRVVATQVPTNRGAWEARLVGEQSSNVLSALALGNAFAVVPRGQADVADGGLTSLEMFRWPSTRTYEEAQDDR
ncbi:MAG: molybdopterin molybdotransferase MoeA [Acidimicrobiia bacterium]|nr:molybdopterin molybdotransferase MoeA [Acidimicrobiia bacterium]